MKLAKMQKQPVSEIQTFRGKMKNKITYNFKIENLKTGFFVATFYYMQPYETKMFLVT